LLTLKVKTLKIYKTLK